MDQNKLYQRLKDSIELREKVIHTKGPRILTWNISTQCNLNCEFCMFNFGKKVGWIKEEEALTLEKIEIVTRNPSFKNVRYLCFTGGEPLMRKDFFEILKMVTQNGIAVGFTTNGTLITQMVAKKIIDSGIKFLTFSIDGEIPSLHNKIRGTKNAFERTIEGVKKLVSLRKESEIPLISCNTVVTNENFSHLPQIGSLCRKLGIEFVTITPVLPTTHNLDKFRIEKFDISIIHDFIKTSVASPLLDKENFELIVYAFKTGKRIINQCLIPSFHSFINYDGLVYPCCTLAGNPKYLMGDLRREDLSQVWAKEEYKRFREETLLEIKEPLCQNCPAIFPSFTETSLLYYMSIGLLRAFLKDYELWELFVKPIFFSFKAKV